MQFQILQKNYLCISITSTSESLTSMPVQELADLNNMKEIHRPTEPSSLEIFHCIVKWQRPQFLSYKKIVCCKRTMHAFWKRWPLSPKQITTVFTHNKSILNTHSNFFIYCFSQDCSKPSSFWNGKYISLLHQPPSITMTACYSESH